LTGKSTLWAKESTQPRVWSLCRHLDAAAVSGTRCETVHRPIAGDSTEDQAVSDPDRRPTTTDEIGAVPV
jgi:hypothetical protein